MNYKRTLAILASLSMLGASVPCQAFAETDDFHVSADNALTPPDETDDDIHYADDADAPAADIPVEDDAMEADPIEGTAAATEPTVTETTTTTASVSDSEETSTTTVSDSENPDETTTTTTAVTSDSETTTSTTPQKDDIDINVFHFTAAMTADGQGIKITGFSGSIEEAVIPEDYNGTPVVEIGKLKCGEGTVQRISIPESVAVIADGAFDDVAGLTDILVNENNEAYMSYDGILYDKEMTKLVFCPALNSVKVLELPDCLNEVAPNAIHGVNTLEELSVGIGITSVGENLFTECPNIKKITVSSAVDYIDTEYIKNNTLLSEYVVDENNTTYTSIDGILYNKELTSMIVCPKYLDKTDISIPAETNDIPVDNIAECSAIVAINVDEANETYSSINGVLLNKEETKLIYYPSAIPAKRYNVPDSVVTLCDKAFRNCDKLKTLALGANTAEFEGTPFTGTTCIASYIAPEENQTFASENGILYTADFSILFRYPEGKEKGECVLNSALRRFDAEAFETGTNITAFSIAEDAAEFMTADGIVFSKDGSAIVKYPAGSSRDYYEIPEIVTTISRNAFVNVYALSGLAFNNTEITVEAECFSGMNPEFVIYGFKNTAAFNTAESCGFEFIDLAADYPTGDVNADGAVNAIDASEILSVYAAVATGHRNKFIPAQKIAADVNNDGAIDAIDASKVLTYYAYTATTEDEVVLSIEEFLNPVAEEEKPAEEEENTDSEEKEDSEEGIISEDDETPAI